MKLQDMRRVRKQIIEQRFEARLETVVRTIRKEVTEQVILVEQTQQRRELNQRLRELANQLAKQTNFDSCRTVRQGYKTWSLVELFRLHGRRYHISNHGHIMYEDWDALDWSWPKWAKVRHGNSHVTNRQMMSIIRKLEVFLA